MNIQISGLKYTNLTYPHVQFMPILQKATQLNTSSCSAVTDFVCRNV